MKYIALIFIILGSLSSFAQNMGSSQSSTYAVVVGISDYQDEGIPDLRFADKDALAFAGFLQSPAGGSLDKDHLKVLTNEQATSGKVAAALYWLIDETKEGDQVIFYFSGHGDVERNLSRQPGFLLCWNAPPMVYMAGGVIELGLFQTVITTLSTDIKAKVTVITDACRSGKLSGNSIGGAQITGANLAKQYANEIKILSCQPDEYSVEGEQWGGGRGAFSYHLLDGLYGLADDDSDMNVNLKEIGRYLEDKVTGEVAPQSQNPMTIGNKTEKLNDVFPEILEQLKAGKRGQMQMFTATDSRGIEEDILAALSASGVEADSNFVEMYSAFKQSLDDKNFLCDEKWNKCTDFYYEKLIAEPKLERLHASMRRNYAAALQDDAQQVLNKWLLGDITEISLSKVNREAKYKRYPLYLERAAELLGTDHYMYNILQARKFYFEGYLMHIVNRNADKELGKKILAKYNAALRLQPESPYVYNSMSFVYFYQMHEPDSAEYYAEKATELVPSWTSPYSDLGFRYTELTVLQDFKKAREFLEMADQVDSMAASSNIWHINNWGVYYISTNQLEQAELKYKKIIQLDSTLTIGYSNLGNVYMRARRIPDAKKQFEKGLEMDSTEHMTYASLGNINVVMRNYDEAEVMFKKALELDSTHLYSVIGLARIYIVSQRFEEGEILFQKAIALDSLSIPAYMTIGSAYMMSNRPESAIRKIQKLLSIDSLNVDANGFLGKIYAALNRKDESEILFKKVLNSGLDYGRAGRYKDAEQIFLKAQMFYSENKQNLHLSKAIVFSLQNQIDPAFESLEMAFRSGYKYKDTFIDLTNDPGLSAVREQKERWNSLMRNYFPGQYKN